VRGGLAREGGGVKEEEEEGKAEGEGAVRVGKKDKRRVSISQTGCCFRRLGCCITPAHPNSSSLG
jgi:hypothetical protein